MTPTRSPFWLALVLCAASGCTLPLRMHMRAVPYVDAPREERVQAWRRYRLAVEDVVEQPTREEEDSGRLNALLCMRLRGAYCPPAMPSARQVRRFRIGHAPRLLDPDQAISVWRNAPDLDAELRSLQIPRTLGLGTLAAAGLGLSVGSIMAVTQERLIPEPQRDLVPATVVVASSAAAALLGWILMRVSGATDAEDASRSERYNRWLLGRLGLEAGSEFVVDPMVATPAGAR